MSSAEDTLNRARASLASVQRDIERAAPPCKQCAWFEPSNGFLFLSFDKCRHPGLTNWRFSAASGEVIKGETCPYKARREGPCGVEGALFAPKKRWWHRLLRYEPV